MGINLNKGGTINLAKEAGPTPLDHVQVALGWDTEADLDASAVICGPGGRALSPLDFVFYNNLLSPTGAIQHMGDERTGGGDAEQLNVQLSLVPNQAASVRFLVSIHNAQALGVHFGVVSGAYIRVVNSADSSELARYSLTENGDGQDCLIFGELYRDGADWHFRAIGEFVAGGLAGAVAAHGLS
jgi:tellurium resistance protein TerD